MAEKFGLEDELTEKVGGVPVWGFGIGFAAIIIAVIWWRSRHAANTAATNTATVAATPQATTSESEGSEDSLSALEKILAGDRQRSFFGGGFDGVPAPTTNEQWAHQMIDHFIGAGEDPALVTDAFDRYLHRERLTVAEAAIIDLALEISIPPQGFLPVLRAGKPDNDKGGKKEKRVRVPMLEGDTAPIAKRKVQRAGLVADFVPKEEGIVAYQSPEPGKEVKKGSTVTLHMAATR